MRLADLPSRVVRPLGDWEEPEAPKFDPKKYPVRHQLLSMLHEGPKTTTYLCEVTGKTRQALSNALVAMKKEGLVDCVNGLRAGDPKTWVAL